MTELGSKVADMKSNKDADAARKKYIELLDGFEQSDSLASLENLSVEGSH